MANEKLSDTVVKAMNKLMELHYDAEKTYTSADRLLAPDGYLDTHLKAQAKLHATCLADLRKVLEDRYLKPTEVSDFFEDAFDEMSMKLTTLLTTDDERVLLQKCQQSQMNMLDNYDHTLQLGQLPTDLREMLDTQFTNVRQSIAETQKMIDAYTDEK